VSQLLYCFDGKAGDELTACRTCAIDPSCVICVPCFQASDHEGHEVLFGQSFSFSAACDCGDPTAWRKDEHLGCTMHPALPPDEEPEEFPIDHVTDDENMPAQLVESLRETVRICLDYIVGAFQYSPLFSEMGLLPKDEIDMRMETRCSGETEQNRALGPWSVTLWSDEKHVLRETTRQIRDGMGVTTEVAAKWAKETEDIVSTCGT
jgi:E3 ubiquitin-protein ligase UBR1